LSLRSRPLFGPGREQGDHFGDPGCPQIWPPGGRIDPAQVRLAVELREGIEERARGWVGRQCCRDIVSQIASLRAFGGQAR